MDPARKSTSYDRVDPLALIPEAIPPMTIFEYPRKGSFTYNLV